ncbi:lipoprotein LipL71 [Leptospira gomenensis]|uniref:Lipoprotein LipL71 n=1 Tax=Leptospira gomenensis TaxID=2484974 RepID=A0A5F1YAE4_9LEPT|nr:lipoprotein LipL71 [Leptospira gomenensis]TGK33696.1 lipoprotein LipL71 [Leptospira gomenensis]TGK36157.1 lipoprotein LipL71 [Leptospira gomenensis]TGK40440.1 lipoprotein LipL71 [Leptospira gomenensis]TGK65962.1 lipoprotein LipL71 [Leptospira gomenensis]
MKSTLRKLLSFFIILLAGFFIACGSELPIQELSDAKNSITRAKSAGAEKYAAGELEEARKSLLNAHQKASDEDLAEAKKSAEYAKAKALDASEKSFPSTVDEARKDSTTSIDSAEEAYASQLASEQYNSAVQLRKEGDALRETADRTLEAYPKESGDDAKLRTRLAAFDQYESSRQKYADSKKAADESKALALSQKQQLIDSLADIEKNLNDADRYAEGKDPEVNETKVRLDGAKYKIEEGKIRDGYAEVDDIRKKSAELVAKNIKTFAEKQKELAKQSVVAATTKLASFDKNKINASRDSQVSYQRAEENLKAAEESRVSAEDLYSSEKYEDSIARSEEAIRLSRIVVDQATELAERLDRKGGDKYANRDSKTGTEGKNNSNSNSNTSEGKNSSSKWGEDGLPEGWKRYVVRKKVPADCLWRIAKDKRHYGTSKLWKRIYEANRGKIKNPNLIFPKQILLIPPAKGSTQFPKNGAPAKKKPSSDAVEAIEQNQKPADSEESESGGDSESKKKNEVKEPSPEEDSTDSSGNETAPEEENPEEENPENLQ